MALLIAPLFTAGIVLGGIQNANAGGIGDLNPPAYRGADNSIHFEWLSGSFPIAPGDQPPPDVFDQVPTTFPLFDLIPFGIPAGGFLLVCDKIISLCEALIPNFVDTLERKFFRVQVSYVGTTPVSTVLSGSLFDFTSTACVRLDRVDEPGYYFEDWECLPNPAFEIYDIFSLDADITQIVIDTISFDGDVPPLPPGDDVFEKTLKEEGDCFTQGNEILVKQLVKQTCHFTIEYVGEPAVITDVVPAEWTVTGVMDDIDNAQCSVSLKGKSGKSATGIDCGAQTDITIMVWLETRPSPGKGHKEGTVFKPTTCDPDFVVNDGAIATSVEVDINGIPVFVEQSNDLTINAEDPNDLDCDGIDFEDEIPGCEEDPDPFCTGNGF